MNSASDDRFVGCSVELANWVSRLATPKNTNNFHVTITEKNITIQLSLINLVDYLRSIRHWRSLHPSCRNDSSFTLCHKLRDRDSGENVSYPPYFPLLFLVETICETKKNKSDLYRTIRSTFPLV